MSRQAITDLRAERAGLIADARELVAVAEARGEDFTAEEAQKYDRIEADIQSRGARIERLEALEGFGPVATPHEAREAGEAEEREQRPMSREQRAREARKADEYRKHMESYLRAGIANEVSRETRAALQVGTDSEGGYIVPDVFVRDLIKSEREFSVIRQLARTLTTQGNGPVQIPSVATHMTATLVAEEGAFQESEPTFGEKTLNAYKYGALSKLSDELVQDAEFDVLALLAEDAGQAIGLDQDEDFVIGDGSNKPNGLVTASSAGVTRTSGVTVSGDNLIDLYHSLISGYRNRPGSGWLMNDSTAAAIRKLKQSSSGAAGDNQYLWQPGLAAGQPDTILGKPVYTDPFVPAIAASAKVVLFGDFSQYWIRDVQGVQIKVLNELYAVNGQIGFRISQRSDGELRDSSAVKALVLAAS